MTKGALQFSQSNHKDVLLAILLVVSLLFAGLGLILNNYHTHKQLHLDKQISTQAVAWHAVDLIHSTGIEAYFNAQINKPEIFTLMREAQDPELEKLARLRLYRKLYPLYQDLKKQGIDIFHFHTADLKSFFRFHQPAKFGCDLSVVRPAIDQVRQQQKPLHGFEVGFLYSGYRHIFPLIDQGEYLGSVELSQPFESLRQEMSLLNSDKEYALIHRNSALLAERLLALGNLMQKSVFSDAWLEEDPLRTLPNAPPMMSDLMRSAAQQIAQDPVAQVKLETGSSFAKSVRINYQFYVFVFTPIIDISNQSSGYVVSFERSPELDLKLSEAGLLGFVLVGMMLFLLVLLLKWIKAKRSQESHLQFLEHINDAMSEGMYVVDEYGYLATINASALRFMGLQEGDVIGRFALDVFLPSIESLRLGGMPEQELAALIDSRDEMQAMCVTEMAFEGEYLFVAPGHRLVWVHLSSQPIYVRGKFIGKVLVFHDITTERSHTEQLRVAAAAFETQEGILITNAQGKIVRVNKAFTTLTGYFPEDIIGERPSILSSGRQTTAFYEVMWNSIRLKGSWQGEIWNRKKSGEEFLEWLNITAVKNDKDEVSEYVAIFSDITEQKKAQDEIIQLAFYDSLTHLPNRRLLRERLSHALVASERQKNFGAVIFILEFAS